MNGERPEIICTLGPVSSNPQVLCEMARAGMTILRINCSHYRSDQTLRLVDQLRAVCPTVKILMDLQGPKIRVVTGYPERVVDSGDKVQFIGTVMPPMSSRGSSLVVPLTLNHDFRYLADANVIYMKDGTMAFEIYENRANQGYLLATTRLGGVIRGEKAVNIPGLRHIGSAITPKDRQDIQVAARMGADAVMASFVRRVTDLDDLRAATAEQGTHWSPRIWAKIETREAMKHLNAISQSANALLIGRGDLWVEVGIAEAPAAQSKILQKARKMKVPCYVATQVLESMRQNLVPTRPEVRDVYLSLNEGASGFMLTAETSVGKFPVQAVQMLRDLLRHYTPAPKPRSNPGATA